MTNFLRKYAQFIGRASRREFFYFAIFSLLLLFIIITVELLLNSILHTNGILLIFFLAIIIIPSIAVGARRLHDINKSGWWQLLILTVVGIIPLIIWWSKAGEKENNKYGNSIKSLETLKNFLINYNSRGKSWKYISDPSEEPFPLRFNLIKEPTIIKEQMQITALSSYIIYENEKIIVDQLSPSSRFGNLIDNKTQLYSMSFGKSLTGYLMAHAICRGYINSLDQKLDDWPLVSNSLFKNVKVKEVLNSTMGDQDFFKGTEGIFKSSGRSPADINIKNIVSNEMLGSKPSSKRYFYNQLAANVALNYIAFKTGYKFRDFLNDIMMKHIRLEGELNLMHTEGIEENGIIQSNFKATRYDTLRIGIAILNDWRSNNSTGEILKDIYSNKISKNNFNLNRFEGYSKSYSGFFHTDYPNINDKVVGMHGTGGISLLINFDANRIVYAHSVYRDYNYDKIILNPIRNGKF